MEREAFRQRMQQYKQARESNPQLKYWDWKSTVQREPLDGIYEDARFIDQSEPRFELRKGQQYYASPNNLKLMKVLGKTVKVLGPIGEVVQNLFPSEEAEILEDARYKYENALKPKVYADGGEVKDNTYVAPVYKEQVFIPATGATKVKNDYQYNYGSKSPYKGGELEIVSPEFDILTGAKAAYDTTVGLINNLSRTNRTRQIVNSFKKNLKTSDKLDVLKDNPEFGQIGTPFDYSNYIDDIFKDSQLKGIYYHGGPNGIEKFRAPKDPEFVLNKAINSGTKEQGIYFTGDKGLANYYKSSNKNGKVYKVKLNSQNPYYTNDWFAVRIRSVLDKDYVYPGSITDRVRYGTLKDHDAVVWHGGLGENIVFDPDQIHILGSKKDMQLFNDYIKNKHSYKNGGVIDEDPPQNTSERPITNFDPKGDPYNPTYGYNPGAGYVRSVFDLYDAPVIGDALSIYDATQALKNKDWLGAGLAALTVVPFIPTVSNYKKSLNQQLNRITGITPDISKLQKQSDWNDLRNRSIERLYDPEIRARAAKIKSDYNVDLQSTYNKIINQYENDYFSLPEAEIVQLQDAKAMLDLQEEAARRYKQYGIKPTQKDFRIKVDNAVTPNQEITNHEINHFNQYIHQDNPSWNKSELNKITKQFDGKLRDKNPIDPQNTSYFMNWMEQNAYGINMLDRLKELNIKPTKQNILKYLKSLPDTDSIKKAALQFKNLDDYIKWLNTMPLADNGNINEIENYNFA